MSLSFFNTPYGILSIPRALFLFVFNTTKLKSAYNSLIMVLEVWDGKPTYRNSWAGNVFVWLDLTLDPFFKVERRYCICSISLNMF